MTAMQAIDDIERQQKQALSYDFAGKMSNQFIAELKSSSLFQLNWSELLSTASISQSLTGTCWIAAAQPSADRIRLETAAPADGFKYLTNRRSPTLRTSLVDACNNGGRMAIALASKNMNALRIRSQRVSNEMIELVFKRLPSSTRDEDSYEDFTDAVQDFFREAQDSARLVTETREAFTKWGLMIGELLVTVEKQQGATSQTISDIEKKFATGSPDEPKRIIEQAANSLAKSQKRLDVALDNVPRSMESIIPGVFSNFTQALPGIVSAAIPTVLSSAIPASLRQSPQPMDTATYIAAISAQNLVIHYFEYLGGDSGSADLSKFARSDTQSGAACFTNAFQTIKSGVDVTNTTDNKKLLDALDKLIRITQEIQRDSGSAESLASWKSDVKSVKFDIVTLAAVADSLGSIAIPNAFATVKPDLRSAGVPSQNAALNTIVQAIQICQAATDLTQANYDAALTKQSKTITTMAKVQEKLIRLQRSNKTVDEIKSILQDHTSVLVDLTLQLSKIETFTKMLSAIIDNIIIPQATSLKRGNISNNTRNNNAVKPEELTKQTIYTLILQLKAYFSLLSDISQMYNETDMRYMRNGQEMINRVSRDISSNNVDERIQQDLAKFNEQCAGQIATFIREKQEQSLNSLRDRASKAAELRRVVEGIVRDKGLVLDDGARGAVVSGAARARELSRGLIEGMVQFTVGEFRD